jgi:protein SCO1
MFRLLSVSSLGLLLLGSGCSPSPAGDKSAAAPPATHQEIFQVKGVVLEVKPEEKTVTIKHEEVPGYMPAMTMPFEVKDTNELAGLEAGDPVSFRMIIAGLDGWIDQIHKTGPKTNTPPTTGRFRRVRDVEPLKEGDLLPEYRFTNQLGQAFSTAQFKGEALAITFLFTRCPFPTFCPLTAENFTETQRKLLARTNGPANWRLLAISFDPEFDTPAVLKAYAELHNYDPRHWTFATGALMDVTAIAEQSGEVFWRDEAGGGISHNLRTVVIDASGRVRKFFAGNQWTPDELAAEMVKAAAAK